MDQRNQFSDLWEMVYNYEDENFIKCINHSGFVKLKKDKSNMTRFVSGHSHEMFYFYHLQGLLLCLYESKKVGI